MTASLLDRIDSPEDLRKLAPDEIEQVTRELRDAIVGTVSRTGGHLASSLGAIELLTAPGATMRVKVEVRR